MSKVPAFHRDRPGEKYHDNNKCGPGTEIKQADRVSGTGNYPHCEKCADLNSKGE